MKASEVLESVEILVNSGNGISRDEAFKILIIQLLNEIALKQYD